MLVQGKEQDGSFTLPTESAMSARPAAKDWAKNFLFIFSGLMLILEKRKRFKPIDPMKPAV
jgi:hypothetical protein